MGVGGGVGLGASGGKTAPRGSEKNNTTVTVLETRERYSNENLDRVMMIYIRERLGRDAGAKHGC